MRSLRTLAFVVTSLLMFARCSRAGDVYFVRVIAGPFPLPNGMVVAWVSGLTFHNSGTAEASVSVLGTSNGVQIVNPSVLTVPAGSTRSEPVPDWQPSDATPAPLSVLHLSVPDGVTVLSQIAPEVQPGNGLCGTSPCGPFIPGMASLPTFRTLVAAGSEQVMMGADLADLSARLDGAFYNGGTATATALVEIRSSCDDHVFGTSTVSIPPNTIVQVNGLPANDQSCTPPADASAWTLSATYVRVVMDQPGFSLVSVQQNGALPALGLAFVGSSGTAQ